MRGWISDQIKGNLVNLLVLGIVLEVVYWLLRSAPETWWLLAGGFWLLFSVVLVNLSPIALMPLFNKFTPLGKEHAGLVERLVRLA